MSPVPGILPERPYLMCHRGRDLADQREMAPNRIEYLRMFARIGRHRTRSAGFGIVVVDRVVLGNRELARPVWQPKKSVTLNIAKVTAEWQTTTIQTDFDINP